MRRVRGVRVRRAPSTGRSARTIVRAVERGGGDDQRGGPRPTFDRPRRGTSPARGARLSREESAESRPEPRG